MTTQGTNDAPIEEIAREIAALLAKHPGAAYFQKWTCGNPACGARQVMDDANALYANGKCEACGHVTQIVRCNFALILPLSAAQ